MDKTKSKLAAFFDEDEEESSFPPKKVDEHKLSQYTQGTSRKSKREKEREAAELKRKEEEEHAARAYAEFLETFEGGGDDGKKKGFVRSSADTGEVYLPSGPAVNSSAPVARSKGPVMPPSPPLAAAKPKGKRAMDSFLEEIKRDQAEREAKYSRHAGHGRSITAMAAYEGQSGSKDRGDPETTNIFVANLPTHVTEQSLGNFFARIGPVGSVKIMWPRGDAIHGPGGDMTASRKNKSSGLSGFVSFMKRKDAEAALRELDGFDWGGSLLRVGWSKAVPVSSKALYTASQTRSRSLSRSGGGGHRSQSHSRSPSRPRGQYSSSRRSRSRSYSRSRSPVRSPRRGTTRRSYSNPRKYSYSRSRSPRHRRASPDEKKSIGDDDVTDEFIRVVASEVKNRGLDFEKTLRDREKSNPKYFFLTDHRHRRHGYYRSMVQSDRIVETEFDDEGYNSIYSTDSAEESEREHVRKHHLGRLARRRFEAMLRGLSGRRGELARCMAFSLEHAEAASEVTDIIISSLVVAETPVPRKVARLHLICDILHNSAAPLPMAWKFRQEFQSRLGLVFDHLSSIYHSFPGRITAETFKKQILSVVEIWEDWIVFSPDYTQELRSRLDGVMAEDEKPEDNEAPVEVQENTGNYSSRFKASSFKPADAGEEELEGPIDEDENIDGEPVDDVDGEPIEDVDGEPIEDVDGEPMLDDDLDGEPMKGGDEDVDGEPMDEDVDGGC